MMNMEAMVQGALFDNTPSASPCGRMPSTSISAAPAIAVTSTAKVSRTKSTSIPSTMASAA